MRLHALSNVGWQNGLDTQHQLQLKLNLHVREIFESANPALELAVRSAQIRTQVFRLFLEGHVPQMLANTGVPSTPSRSSPAAGLR